MSRVGKVPVLVPSNVDVKINDARVISVSSSGKEMNFKYSDLLSCVLKKEGEKSELTFSMVENTKFARAQWGLSRNIVANMIEGITQGFKKDLELVGVGFKAAVVMNGRFLMLSLGYSHDILYLIPEGVTIKCEKPTTISIFGIDKQLVGQVAAKIRALKVPEPYKGKGIKYTNEEIRRKAGKR